MQTLGLSDTTPRTETRFKNLFWPTIRNEVDLESVTTQGFWVCFAVSVFTLLFGLTYAGFSIGLLLDFAFFFLGGIGVRRSSRFAAISVFAVYLLSTLMLLTGFVTVILSAMMSIAGGFLLLRLLFLALLLANVRGIWVSAGWPKAEAGSVPVIQDRSWGDKLSDSLPAFLWPKVRIVFYVFAGLELALVVYLFAAAAYRTGLLPLR